MKPPRIPEVDRGRLAVAASLLFVLVLIAMFAHDRWLRPYGGDFLVVVFLYFLTRLVTPIGRWPCAVLVFAIACAVELMQALDLVARLGLADNALARTLVGANADPADIIAYAAGAVCAVVADRR